MKHKRSFWKLLILFHLVFYLIPNATNAQITGTVDVSAEEMAAYLAGDGVTIFNASLNPTCHELARGKFMMGAVNELGIDSGVILTNGLAFNLEPLSDSSLYPSQGSPYGSNAPFYKHSNFHFMFSAIGFAPGDTDLFNEVVSYYPGYELYFTSSKDACALEFDIVTQGTELDFRYVFASEEYSSGVCSPINDFFAFFIEGPGFASKTNIALVPGTSTPVGVNSINNVPNADTLYFCANLGPGVPFSEYYVDNANVLQSDYIVYDGFTTPLTAHATVNPCDTYHIKLVIADFTTPAANSAAFIEAGSFTSGNIEVKAIGGAGLSTPYDYTARACPPGKFEVKRTGSNLSNPLTVNYNAVGTAINGVDYTTIPGSITIPAGDSVAYIDINPLLLPAAVGPRSVIIQALNPWDCSDEAAIIASDTLMILDSLYIAITTPDSNICIGSSIQLQAQADTALSVVWTPTPTLPASGLSVTATPATTTTYTATASLSFSGCSSVSDTVRVTVKNIPVIDAGPTQINCGYDSTMLLASAVGADDEYSYSWTPTTAMSSSSVLNPLVMPSVTTDYVLTVNSGAVGCDATDTTRVRVVPNEITLANNDTTVCAGTSIILAVAGDPAFNYQWTPEDGIVNPLAQVTAVTASTTRYIHIMASAMGCADMRDSFLLTVEPVPVVQIDNDTTVCGPQLLQLFASVSPADFSPYTYRWTGDNMGLNDTTINNPTFLSHSGTHRIIATVSTPNGCIGSDTMMITVNSANFLNVNTNDTGICPPDAVLLIAEGAGNGYTWSPQIEMGAVSEDSVWVRPVSDMTYTVIGESEYGCLDTQYIHIAVFPAAEVSMPDTAIVWPGRPYQIPTETNAHYFEWYPPEGLDNIYIANPIANPHVRTRYFLTARTEHGCVLRDSIDIIVPEESICKLPNAFVPGNSNAVNARFKLNCAGIATIQDFSIYNRWGERVYHTTDDDHQGWDGTYQGQAQPSGVYVYQLDAILNNGKRIQLSGNVTLVR